MASSTHGGGRPRDAALDERIRAATRQLLAERGYQGLSIGSLYGRYLASSEIPPDWPERVVRPLWAMIQADGTAQPPDR